ncbi:hypothetical protein BU25DRAFT_345430, partial [Macroventuria anomochaeta]
AEAYGVPQSTLQERINGCQPNAIAHQQPQQLTPEQEQFLHVKYIKGLTEQHLPPTRQMIQNFATEIAGDEVSESWVTCFLNRHTD